MLENLNFILKNLQNDITNLPEMVLFSGFLLLLVTDIFISKHKKITLTIIFLATIIICELYSQNNNVKDFSLFSGSIQIDATSVNFGQLLSIMSIFTIFLAYKSTFLKNNDAYKGEFFTILMAMLLGLRLMCISANLLLAFLAIEIVSMSSYILTYFSFKKQSSEASLKYLLFGAVASAVMLYGISWLYGLTGTLNFLDKIFLENLTKANPQAVNIAVLFILGGLLFKLGIFPFHIWLPDVYEATPTPVVAFFSVAPKIAGVALLWRFFQEAYFQEITFATFLGNFLSFKDLLAILLAITILIGNLSAFWQTNVKRMLAYSSIANAGFLVAGVLISGKLGLQVIQFYVIFYALANFLVFGLVEVFSKKINSANTTNSINTYEIENYRGLGSKMPFLGILWLVGLVALAGLPPTVGFSAKVLLFSGLWAEYETSKHISVLILLVIGILNTIIGIFYYLKIPYKMFIQKANQTNNSIAETLHSVPRKNLFEIIFLSILAFLLIVLFIKPDLFF
jgi:NADH-quinone oxidoreductase subunit N